MSPTQAGPMLRSPALLLAGSFALGVALAGGPGEGATALLRAIPLLFGACGVFLLAGLLLLRAGRQRLATLLLLGGFTLAGAAAAFLFTFRFPPEHLSHLGSWGIDVTQPVRLEGWLRSDPVLTPSGLEFDLEATSLGQVTESRRVPARSVTGKVRVWVETAGGPASGDSEGAFDLRYGDSVRTAMRLGPPRVHYNPGGFDFRQRAESIEDLYWEGAIQNAGDLRKLPGSPHWSPGRFAEQIRRRLRDAIDRLYPPWSSEGRDGAVLKAILLGDRSSLDSGTIDQFRKSGLYHLLVVAGLHVGLLALLLLGLLRLLGLGRSPRDLMLLVALVAYAFVVEQRAPTLRATLMLVIFVAARLLDRGHSALNAIALAALVLLLARPAWLFDTGFQLSFAAALLIAGLAAPVLALTTEPYRRALRQLEEVELDAALRPGLAQFRLDLRSLIATLRRRSGLLDRHATAARRLVVWPLEAALRLSELLLFSAVLQIGLMLPMVEAFHRVTLAGIGLNALALPLMTVLLALAFPTVLLAAVAPTWAAGPAQALSAVLSALFSVSGLPHLPHWLSYRVPAPPLAVAAGFAALLVILALTLGRSRLGLLVASLAFVAFAVLVATDPFAPRVPTSALEVTALDCGNGEAIFLVLPDQATMLIGAGGAARAGRPGVTLSSRWDPGENIVSPYLWSRGLKSLDVLVVQNTGGGSLDGFASILENFRVRELWHGPGFDSELGPALPAFRLILEEAARRGVQVREVSAGEKLTEGATQFEVLWPPKASGAHSSARDDSVVLRVVADKNSVLVSGDLSGRAERRLLDAGAELSSAVLAAALEAVLQPSAPDFLQKVSPRIAVLTTGASNRTTHARAPAIAEFEAEGIRVLGTELDGAITVEMSGPSLVVRTFRGGRKISLGPRSPVVGQAAASISRF